MTSVAYQRLVPGAAVAHGRCEIGPLPAGVALPLVSCLMVTRGNAALVATAIASFGAQRWANRELVIVCDAVSDELRALVATAGPAVRLEAVPAGLNLGDLRNIALGRSRGDFVCQWDDDDLYDPGRIELSMKVIGEARVDAVFMDRWLQWWPAKDRLFVSPVRIWEGSMLARRSSVPAYPALVRGEDNIAVQWLVRERAVAVLIDCAWLYCYRVTGENTWDDAHFEKHYANATKVFTGAESEKVMTSLPCFAPLRGPATRSAGDAAADAVPPDAADGLRLHGAALRAGGRA